MLAKVIRFPLQGPIAEIFGAGGMLAKNNPGYEERPGQIDFASAVHSTLTDGGVALLEGPCGTGKSIGYLAPLIRWIDSERRRGNKHRVVVATASIALQEQLVTKDLPAMQRALPWEFAFALLKGRSNYACHDRAEEIIAGDHVDEQEKKIVEWCRNSPTGDRSDLGFVPAENLWKRFTVDSDDCKGKHCDYNSKCHYLRARNSAARADIAVVNHHLLAAHMQLVEDGAPEEVAPLGKFNVLICDEAHDLPEAARSFWGADFTERYFDGFKETEDRLWEQESKIVAALGRSWFRELSAWAAKQPRQQDEQGHPTVEINGDHPKSGDLGEALQKLLRTLPGESHFGNPISEEGKRRLRNAQKLSRKGEKLLRWVRTADQANPSQNMVCWLDLPFGNRSLHMRQSPVSVAEYFREMLFSRGLHAIVFASATLTTDGTFDFIRNEFGVDNQVTQRAVESPFDFASRCVVAIPRLMPPPPSPKAPAEDDEKWLQACATAVGGIIAAADGRTLVLFTSKRSLEYCAERLMDDKREWLIQGSAPPAELARRFRDNHPSVLFGLKTFWTGIDVPGDSLRVVVIDRIPFQPARTPVSKRAELLLGNKFFGSWMLPRALMQLRQGFGRLIRSTTDWGVVVILDSRMNYARWSGSAWRSLPSCRKAETMQEIKRFLLGGPASVSSAPIDSGAAHV